MFGVQQEMTAEKKTLTTHLEYYSQIKKHVQNCLYILSENGGVFLAERTSAYISQKDKAGRLCLGCWQRLIWL